MIWHVVRLDCSGIAEEERRDLEASLAALARLEDVAWLRVARDVEDPNVTGLLTVFTDADALTRYRVHPEHVPVVERIRALGIPTVRLDVATDDEVADLP
ncbi:MAG: Dabb family protein [Nitriliruptoraceae bacterium]